MTPPPFEAPFEEEEDFASAWRFRFCNQSISQPRHVVSRNPSAVRTFALVSPRPMVVLEACSYSPLNVSGSSRNSWAVRSRKWQNCMGGAVE